MTAAVDRPDWTIGSTPVTTGRLMIPETNFTGVFAQNNIDVSGQQSIAIEALMDFNPVASDLWRVQVQWLLATDLIISDTIVNWDSELLRNPGLGCIYELPVRGPTCNVVIQGITRAGNGVVLMTASSKAIAGPLYRSFSGPLYPCLFSVRTRTIAPGATDIWHIGPYSRAANVVFAGTNGKVTLQIEGIVNAPGLADPVLYEYVTGEPLSSIDDTIYAGNMANLVTVVNSSTGNHAYSLAITDVS